MTVNDEDGEIHPDVRDILEDARKRANEAERRIDEVEARSFEDAVEDANDDNRTPLIAEVKPTSPTTQGVKETDPVEAAREMVEGGASALSVLTEPEHFGGSLENLRRVRDAVEVPVLRKDFILDSSQLYEVETDMVLLIAAFLDDELGELVDEALSLGLQPLVEVHTHEELERALDTDAGLIGVNSRDLKQLEVDLSVSEDLLPEVPDDRIGIAESGIETREDVERMVEAGADALLVGTAIMQDEDVSGTTRRLVGARETQA